MNPTRVINIRDAESGWETNPLYEYIGRGWRQHPRASKWGNPFREKDFGRDECIRRHRYEVERKLGDPTQRQFWQDLKALQGKILVCYCKPKPCHGDNLAMWADYLGGYDNPNEGPLVHIEITPEQQRAIQKDLNLFIEFNKVYEKVKLELETENSVLQFQFEMALEEIQDAHTLREVMRKTMKMPYDRQEMWLEFRRRRNEV